MICLRGTQSVRKALEPLVCRDPNNIGQGLDYKGIDIYSPEGENIIFDLSQDNIVEKLKEVLGDWKPDFIWASPLCTTFSRATCIPNGTLAYIEDKGKLSIRQDFSMITHNNYVNYKDDPKWVEEQKGKQS